MPTPTLDDEKIYRPEVRNAFKIGAHLYRPGMRVEMTGAAVKEQLAKDPESFGEILELSGGRTM